ncbi:MAG: hypothetical protein ACTSP3_11125 [Candidatus Heimdallarchaeaceae archaeon]
MYNQRNLAQHAGVLPNVSEFQDCLLSAQIDVVFRIEILREDYE